MDTKLAGAGPSAASGCLAHFLGPPGLAAGAPHTGAPLVCLWTWPPSLPAGIVVTRVPAPVPSTLTGLCSIHHGEATPPAQWWVCTGHLLQTARAPLMLRSCPRKTSEIQCLSAQPPPAQGARSSLWSSRRLSASGDWMALTQGAQATCKPTATAGTPPHGLPQGLSLPGLCLVLSITATCVHFTPTLTK